MDLKVYLPDKLGHEAKAAQFNFSGMLRQAVEDELRRMAAVDATKDTEWSLELETDDGDVYTGKIWGELLAETNQVWIYQTIDGGVIVYEPGKLKIHDVDDDDPADGLRDWLPDDEYIRVCSRLGVKAVVDL